MYNGPRTSGSRTISANGKKFENVEKMTYRVHSFPGVRSVNGKTLTSVDLTACPSDIILFNF